MHSVNLFFNYYEAKSKERQKELEFCLKKNVGNKFIDKIFLIKEEGVDIKNIVEQEFLNSKIILINYNKTPTFEYVVNLIKEHSKNDDVNIIMNSDCFIEEKDMEKLKYLKENEAWCLTRYNIKNINPFEYEIHTNSGFSQDCFIFKRNKYIKNIKNINFKFGTPGCDNRFAFELSKSGIKTINPSFII